MCALIRPVGGYKYDRVGVTQPHEWALRAQVLRRFRLLDEDDVDELETVGERAQAARLSRAAEDDELGDAPDEFLDPLTYDLMSDPVLLPRM